MAEYVSGLKLGKKIGNGHFGDVFNATDTAHGEVAAKVLGRKAHHDESEWDSYKGNALGEAQHLSKATHRNVVQVHHVVEGDGGNTVVICMEFCPGGSLQAKFEEGPMPLGAVRKAATEVLLGLSALHSRSMLHRDIKPANILLDGSGVAKLGDFGLVTDDLILGYGSAAGYGDHIAYEVWHGDGTSPKSDIWALGMTLYRLLHGQTWYDETPKPRKLIEDGDFLSVAESFQMRVDDSLSGQESGTNLDRRSVIPPGFNRRNRDGFVLTDDIDVCLAVFAKSNRPGWQQIRRDLC